MAFERARKSANEKSTAAGAAAKKKDSRKRSSSDSDPGLFPGKGKGLKPYLLSDLTPSHSPHSSQYNTVHTMVLRVSEEARKKNNAHK